MRKSLKSLLVLILCLAMVGIGCAHTTATHTKVVNADGSITTTVEIDRLDSEACFGGRLMGDCISTKNASWTDRLFKIPQLFTVLIGQGAAAP